MLLVSATTYAWFLHDHLGSTVAVYGSSENGEGQLDLEHAYEYRSFGEMAELTSSADKVTKNFTGKEKDDETGLSNHGARLLDPMLGVWISVDPKRFFFSSYVYMGNGYNPIRFADLNGEKPGDHFDTPDQAAIDWVGYANVGSTMLNMEFCAYMYRTPDGEYVAAEPVMASTNSFTIHDLEKSHNPNYGTIEAVLHTHGWGDNPVTGEYESNQFSEADRLFMNSDVGFGDQLNALYLGNPQGQVLKIGPDASDPVDDAIMVYDPENSVMYDSY